MDMDHLGTGAILAVMLVEVIEMLKSNPRFAWVTKDTAVANRWLGAVVACASGLGIHAEFHAGTFMVTGLVLSSIGHAAAQWAQQQVYYRLVVNQTKEKGA